MINQRNRNKMAYVLLSSPFRVSAQQDKKLCLKITELEKSSTDIKCQVYYKVDLIFSGFWYHDIRGNYNND